MISTRRNERERERERIRQRFTNDNSTNAKASTDEHETTVNRGKHRHTTTSVVLLVFTLAVGLRLLGVWHGYPHAWSDEFNFVHRALAVGTGDFAPQDFTRPVFFIYLLFIEYAIYYVVGWLLGWWEGSEAFALEYLRSTAYLVILGRLLCVAFSIATVFVVYRLCTRHFGQRAAIIASAWLAVNFGHVSMSQTLNGDVAAGFFAVLALGYLLDHLSHGKLRALVFGAMAIGAGAATKYYPIVMLLSLAATLWYAIATERGSTPYLKGEQKKVGNRYTAFLTRTSWASAVVILTFFVLTPLNFIHADGLSLIADELRALGNWIHALVTGTEAPKRPVELRAKTSHGEGFYHYFRLLFMQKSLGAIEGPMAVIALAVCVFGRDPRLRIVAVFPLLLIVFSIVNRPGFADVRHQVPMFAHLAVAVGVVASNLYEGLSSRLRLAFVGVGSVLFVIVAGQIGANNIWTARTDARTLAKHWIETNIPPDSKILLMNYTVRLLPNKASLARERQEIKFGARQFAERYPDRKVDSDGGLWRYFEFSERLADRVPGYDLLTLRAPEWRFGDQEPPRTRYYHDPDDLKIGDPYRRYGVESLDYYRARNFEYVLIDGFSRLRFDKKNYPVFNRFLEEVDAGTSLLAEFVADRDGSPGYSIEVRRIN